jgi:hypothetical protein
MVEASPAAAFIMPKSDFLFQVLITAFDRRICEIDGCCDIFRSGVANQYSVGLVLPSGHSTSSALPVKRCCDRH